MSGVLNRTIRMESKNNRYRFGDWNIVNTVQGGCWEPRNFNVGNQDISATGALTVDPDDQTQKIDMVTFDYDRRDPFFRDPNSNRPLIGGALWHWVKHSFN